MHFVFYEISFDFRNSIKPVSWFPSDFLKFKTQDLNIAFAEGLETCYDCSFIEEGFTQEARFFIDESTRRIFVSAYEEFESRECCSKHKFTNCRSVKRAVKPCVFAAASKQLCKPVGKRGSSFWRVRFGCYAQVLFLFGLEH